MNGWMLESSFFDKTISFLQSDNSRVQAKVGLRAALQAGIIPASTPAPSRHSMPILELGLAPLWLAVASVGH
jgi:hypothetical protein